MAAVKKAKQLMYKGKPIYRVGNTIYYGNLSDQLILVLNIKESKAVNGVEIATKVELELMDNTGELGAGQIFRKTERENLYKALDLGTWWLQDALQTFC